jgi:1-deoxy-D-xylulose-5-phosphate synthase
MIVMAPSDENEARQLLYTGFMHKGPAAVRYPRGSGPNAAIEPSMTALPIGKGVLRREGRQVAILSFGTLLPAALQTAERLNASVADMRFVKPLDEELIAALAQRNALLVTLEENAVQGGAGSAVTEFLNARGIDVPVLQLGVPDTFIDHGTHAQQLAQCGLDAAGIESSIRKRLVQLGLSSPVAPVRSEAGQ